jgi:hypothetical protein
MNQSLNRPRILVTAAKIRARSLSGRERASWEGLLAMEAELEFERKNIHASYSTLHHVELLARIVRAAERRQENASGS